ncbi:coiled-coil domain-containing protein 107 isoform X2 [Erinaceus europaeus]|uniref:Coiled-coil domain-containing protein 107 isoform X2 n=1 Tax=Erinaceus europaeus TaxID=9365 RepID=A0A1S3WAS6_ERIEU|nr:coiled-coil domain-containing protein 107 isoform X2 [Erinaceus europaeus]
MRTGAGRPRLPLLEPSVDPAAMASAVWLWGVLGVLLVSALPEALGDRPSPDLRAYPGDPAQVGPGAPEPRRRPPRPDQRERARVGALPLGALYTAAAVAFVLYKCLQGKDEAAILEEEAGRKESIQSEQQLAQLAQQLAQTEQHLNSLMAQLDPLFDRVTTLAGAQQELLNMKLQTIHGLMQDSQPNEGVEVTEPETSIPFLENLCIEKDEEAVDRQTWEQPLSAWGRETKDLPTAWEVGQGLRKRCRKAAVQDPSHKPCRGGGTFTEGLVKQSLFL